jgi:UDP-glucose 4-epimerase
MSVLVTGSAGHLGEAIVRTLRELGRDVVGVDIKASAYTDRVGTIVDRRFVSDCMTGIDAVMHAATLHKPHVATHSKQDFIDTNVNGTLNLLEEAAAAGVDAFVFTSTTSAFGDALRPPAGAPAAWITEDVVPVPKNIYGATKTAAEDLCRLFHRNQGLPCVVLRTSRFFPEVDDDASRRRAFDPANLKVCELLNRRVDLADVVDAHLLAVEHAPRLGFERFIVSATTPFARSDVRELRGRAPDVVRRYVPGYEAVFEARGWRMPDDIERVYVNRRARERLGWDPRHDFARAIDDLGAGRDYRSALARAVGAKGYHDIEYPGGAFPAEA